MTVERGKPDKVRGPSPLGRRPNEVAVHTSRPVTPQRARQSRSRSPLRDAAVKPRGLGMRTWLRIGAGGETQIIEADKYAIMRRCAIPARDLRILDPVLVYPSTILGREQAIVINLEHIKAIVTAEEVLLQNFQNPQVQLFAAELQRRLHPHTDPHSTEMPATAGPPPSFLPLPPAPSSGGSMPLSQPHDSMGSDTSFDEEALLLAPGLTAHPPAGVRAGAVAQAAVSKGERAKSPLGQVTERRPPSGIYRRWEDLQRENSLMRGRSWSPVRQSGGGEPPRRHARGITYSPARGGSSERVRSLSPVRGGGGRRDSAQAPRGRGVNRQGEARAASRGVSPAPQQGRTVPPPQEPDRWAPLAALRDRMFGRKKSYQRLVLGSDSDSQPASLSAPPSSQVLYLEGPVEKAEDALAAHGLGSAPVALPFEFRALEVILETVCGHLDVKSIELEQEAYPALDELTVKISAANLERVRRFKSRLVGLSVRVQKVRDELEGLLDDDGDMAEMYLTAKLLSALEPASPASSFTAAGGFGSTIAGSPPSRRRSSGDHAFPASHPPPLPVLDLNPPQQQVSPVTPTPRLGPIQPGILDVGFSTESAPQELQRAFSFNPRLGSAPESTSGEGGTSEPTAEARGGAEHEGMRGEAEDQVAPLIRHASSHSQRSFRRGRSRSRSASRSASRSRGSHGSRSVSRSSKSTRKSGKGEDVEELEMLLEAYFAQIEGTLNKLSALREYIDDTEDYINIRLDDHQNQLLLLVIVITIGTVATTIAVVVSGVFGMNVPTSLYHNPNNFPRVMWSTLAACLVTGIGVVGWLKWKKLLTL